MKRTAISTARVFWSGRSQAVRLPKQYRFEGSVVSIHREGRRIVLEPPVVEVDEKGWPKGYWTNLPTVEPTFGVGHREQPHERRDPLFPGRTR
jgi:antitoxin VapB